MEKDKIKDDKVQKDKVQKDVELTSEDLDKVAGGAQIRDHTSIHETESAKKRGKGRWCEDC